jgi:hypothetical protein
LYMIQTSLFFDLTSQFHVNAISRILKPSFNFQTPLTEIQ